MSNSNILNIEKLLFNFLNLLKELPGGKNISLPKAFIGTNKNPSIIKKDISEYLNKIEKIITNNKGIMPDKEVVIVASLIYSILKHQPFRIDPPVSTNKRADPCIRVLYPNEYFVIYFIEVMYNLKLKENDMKLTISKFHANRIVKLLEYYKKDINKCEPFALTYILELVVNLHHSSRCSPFD